MRPENAVATFSGERLRLARFRAALTLRELAGRVGLTHTAISQFENGHNRPTATVLARLALATGVSVEFFAFNRRPVSKGGLDGVHFRSLRSTSRQSRAHAWSWSEIVLDITDVLEGYVRLPKANIPLAPISDHNGPASAASILRSAWGLPDGPIGHLVRHMEVNGIVIARLEVADRGIDAFSHTEGPRPVTILGTDKGDAARSRFDAAHELGHLVCHPEADAGGLQESQAHAFAAELLMPRTYFLQILPRRFDLGAYVHLKQEWGVSIAALLYRAKSLKVISDAAYRRAVMIMNKRYGRNTEPYPLSRPEMPTLLFSACQVAENLGISLRQIATESCVSLEDLNAVIGDPDPRPAVNI
jgi:Zn-dependent peptidase ImmA (M78 family)/transcriptional regulator with XRE-family HTH domain